MNNLEQKIESVLFFKGEPIKIKKLAQILEEKEEVIIESLKKLKSSLENRGISLMEKEDEVFLVVSLETSSLIEKIQKEELNRDLSKASLETLSIILYKNGATRSEIDYIRGVNSNFTLRILSIRGLVEKIADKNDSRRFIYKPTFDLLSFLGITTVEEMPGFNNLKEGLEKLKEDINEIENS